MDPAELVGRFPGVTLGPGNTVFFKGLRIGVLDISGETLVFRLLVHRLDYEPLLSEYPFLAPSPEGYIEVLLDHTPGDEVVSALLECISSAVDRASESSGESILAK
jgi:hypothetical protein